MLTTETFMFGFFVGLLEESRRSPLDVDLEAIFLDKKSRNMWLRRAHSELGGRTPLQAIQDGQGELVRHILNVELGYCREL